MSVAVLGPKAGAEDARRPRECTTEDWQLDGTWLSKMIPSVAKVSGSVSGTQVQVEYLKAELLKDPRTAFQTITDAYLKLVKGAKENRKADEGPIKGSSRVLGNLSREEARTYFYIYNLPFRKHPPGETEAWERVYDVCGGNPGMLQRAPARLQHSEAGSSVRACAAHRCPAVALRRAVRVTTGSNAIEERHCSPGNSQVTSSPTS